MATELRAQPADPNVEVRVVGDEGPTNNAVVEPEIAVGHDAVVIVDFRLGLKSRYAILNRATGVWYSYVFDVPWTSGTTSTVDLSVAYDPNTHGFLATALAQHTPVGGSATHYILASRLIPDSGHANGIGEFEEFAAIDTGSTGQIYFDKPYVVAGEWRPTGREYYCVYMTPGLSPDGYRYRRSLDGGATWEGDEIAIGATRVSGTFCATPATYGDRDLYIVYQPANELLFRFVRGQDPQDPNQVDGMTFTYLPQECEVGLGEQDPVELTIPYETEAPDIGDYLPGTFSPKRVPQLVADPSSDARMYLVFHDSDPNHPTDINVYLYQLNRSGEYWCPGPKRRVNADIRQVDDDQFMPSVAVDDHGYVHVVYYDDRRYDQSDGMADPNNPHKFDCYYAYSKNGGVSWDEWRLDGENATDPAISLADVAELKEYIGIDWFGDDVFTAFTGSVPYDPNDPPTNHPGVIWSSRIRW